MRFLRYSDTKIFGYIVQRIVSDKDLSLHCNTVTKLIGHQVIW